ncbi:MULTISPECIES: hypothetical protein [Mesotoga]|mgnify:FL=1|jgi:hypothetical protein|uniref:Macrophage migration inhibitory factor (MIF) n=1 Tax=Mesotoga prima MesG1.Ag.4.2 TaxID=660470 RepID=I2F6T3_9BACT|nr:MULTISPECIES: hypothetical protein [Mesotoga]MCP5457561.1 hypothetical protein [Thermotogota bacterium]CCU84469.1 conserved hypothetical protein [Mesotoga infera]AFK07636.1 hypothetical protein Theba_1993 [Mesotoga prima MesG1.Ag.4.2]MCP5461245.1 hypothetical protein [Thermotogota bacterium]PIJ63569.1 hypothetical protein V513_00260 [Mesotoga sp. H07.pep.5.3]
MYIVCDLTYAVSESRSTEALKMILETLSKKLLLGAQGDTLNMRAETEDTIEVQIMALKGSCSFEEVVPRINEYLSLISRALETSFPDYRVVSSYIYLDGEETPYLLC